MKEKRYEITKRKDREGQQGRPFGINSMGDPAPFEQEVLKRRGHFEMPLPRSSPVDEQGVQMQQGRDSLKKPKRK
jgi:hypothetical protein